MILLTLATILLIVLSQCNHTRYAGTFHKGNYIWGGAMNIAWTQLVTNIIHEPVRLNTKEQSTTKLLDIFNNPVFNSGDMNINDYYAKSGFGSKTVDLINRQMRKKFPQYSFGSLPSIEELDIISYAYLYKKVKYPIKFTKTNHLIFNGKIVKGFEVKTAIQKQNVFVNEYINQDNFVIQLKTDDQYIELLLFKSGQKLSIDQVVAKITKIPRGPHLSSKDICKIPNVKLDIQRDYKQLQKIPFLNQKYQRYEIGLMKQNIKFDMDEVGVRVENLARIVVTYRSARMPRIQRYRYLLLNKPFWILMRYKGKHPFFIANINIL